VLPSPRSILRGVEDAENADLVGGRANSADDPRSGSRIALGDVGVDRTEMDQSRGA
jgi:hypothetical protein